MTNKRTRGAALLTALLVVVTTSLLLSASLLVSQNSTKLGYNQVSYESAIQAADAGINSEIQYIATNSGQIAIANRSSQPVVYSGTNLTNPNTNALAVGRYGTIGNNAYFVYASNDAAGTIPWDSYKSPFYITATGICNKVWKTVQVTASKQSAFNVYGIFGLCNDDKAVTVNSGSTVTITGTGAVNGGVNQSGSITAPNCLNADTDDHPTGQFNSSNSNNIGSCNRPITYPKTTDVLKVCTGQTGSSTNTIWNNCSGNNGIVYEYKDSSNNTVINPSNCVPYQKQPTTLMNSCWAGVHQKPVNSYGIVATGNKKVQTMILSQVIIILLLFNLPMIVQKN